MFDQEFEESEGSRREVHGLTIPQHLPRVGIEHAHTEAYPHRSRLRKCRKTLRNPQGLVLPISATVILAETPLERSRYEATGRSAGSHDVAPVRVLSRLGYLPDSGVFLDHPQRWPGRRCRLSRPGR